MDRQVEATNQLGPRTQRLCPHCGNPVAQRAQDCLHCGAHLREVRRRGRRLALGDLLVPLLVVAGVVALLLWKPWEARPSRVVIEPSATPTETPQPTSTYRVVPSATPLSTPTFTPAPTLPPGMLAHTVEAGETVTSIAKLYGTTKEAILKENNLKESTLLSVGQQLRIPLPAADTPTPTVTPTPSPTPFTYTVRTADTLSEIARKFGTTVEALMQANNIEDATRLQVGSKLVIVQPPDYSATMAYAVHEVVQGETLSTIAAKYGLSVATIKEVNGLTGDRLSVGQKLRIPVGTATPTPTPTHTPAPTATPAPPYPAPALLVPPEASAFEGGRQAQILLAWASVGILGSDEWYVLHLRGSSAVSGLPRETWTKSTSWRMPVEVYPEGQSVEMRFRWWVSVMRQTGTAADGTYQGVALSPAGQTRTFTWK